MALAQLNRTVSLAPTTTSTSNNVPTYGAKECIECVWYHLCYVTGLTPCSETIAEQVTGVTSREVRTSLTEFPDPSDLPRSAWEYYLEVTGIEDSEREREWQELLDVILVFVRPRQRELYSVQLTQSITQAALFASVLSTFLIETLSSLQEDPLDAIQNILLYQTLVMQNRTAGPYVAPTFSPPPYAVAVNTLFFASLGVVLVTAFLCMLAKGWIRALDRKLWEIPDLQRRAVIKELREQGLHRWRLQDLITILPSLVHLSLLLFFIGLTVYLLHTHKLPASLLISIFGIGVLVYALSIIVSTFDKFSPFQPLYSRVLDADSSPADETILVPALNKVWGVTHYQYDSVYAKNLFKSILPYLDDLKIRLLGHWHPYLSNDTSRFSTKEARHLAYGICMQGPSPDNAPPFETLNAVIGVLNDYPDPWSHLVASLLQVRLNDATWDSPIAPHEADIITAISNVDRLTTDQWCFSLSSTSVLFARNKGLCGPEEIPAVMRILARLLQKGLHHEEAVDPGVTNTPVNRCTDFWLYVVMSVLDKETPSAEVRASTGGILHARDIEACASGMTQDTNYIRHLLQLSRDRNLDPSLMRSCLVSIVYILVSTCLRGHQEITLVNQYLDIIEEEFDLIAWNHSFSELLTSTHTESNEVSATVLCLLRGQLVDSLDDREPNRAAATILREYDLKLSNTDLQLTTSILKVMDHVILNQSWIAGLVLQNSWLSLYAHNRARLPYNSAIPAEWSSDCTSVASERLDLYDSFDCFAEIDLINFFLSSPSASIACRALRWYLHIKGDAFTSGDVHDFISFPTIFRKGLSVDENRESWLLLVENLIPTWNEVSTEWRTNFVKAFFGQEIMADRSTTSGVGDEEITLDPLDPLDTGSTTQTGGLGWMEDVWTTVLQPLVREVHVGRLESSWSGLSGVMHAAYPESARLKEFASLLEPNPNVMWDEPSEGMPHDGDGADPLLQSVEERLEVSARSLLGVLAPLLEAVADLIPTALLNRHLRNSPLLLDERLHHDTESLYRIKAVLNPTREG